MQRLSDWPALPPEGLVGIQEQQDRQVPKRKPFTCICYTSRCPSSCMKHTTSLESGQEGCKGAWEA